jgi:hypothetical protein
VGIVGRSDTDRGSRENFLKQSFWARAAPKILEMIDLIAAIDSVKFSSKSELSSRSFGRLKFCVGFGTPKPPLRPPERPIRGMEGHGYSILWTRTTSTPSSTRTSATTTRPTATATLSEFEEQRGVTFVEGDMTRLWASRSAVLGLAWPLNVVR